MQGRLRKIGVAGNYKSAAEARTWPSPSEYREKVTTVKPITDSTERPAGSNFRADTWKGE